MFSANPNPPHDYILPTVPGDQMSLLPVINAAGELVYCLPNPALNLSASLHPQMPAGTLPLNCMQHPELITMCAPPLIPSSSADGMLMSSLQNGLFSLPSSHQQTNSLTQPMDIFSHRVPITSALEPREQLIGKYLYPQATSKLTNRVTQITNSQNLQTCMTGDKSPAPGDNRCGSFLPTTFQDLPPDTASFAGLLRGASDNLPIENGSQHMHQYTKKDATSLNQLGPVEKAVYKEAFYTQKKKRTTSDCQVSVVSKVQFDVHFKNIKHSPGMFKHRIAQESSSCGSAGLQFNGTVGSAVRIAGPASSNNILPTCQTYTDQINATLPPTSVSPYELHNPSYVVPQTNSSVLVHRRSKTPVLPAIRYHPYQGNYRSVTQVHNIADMSQSDGTASNNPVSSIFNQNEDTSAKVLQTKNTSINKAIVHSVSVPRCGGYTLLNRRESPTEEEEKEAADQDIQNSTANDSNVEGDAESSRLMFISDVDEENDHKNKTNKSISDDQVVKDQTSMDEDVKPQEDAISSDKASPKHEDSAKEDDLESPQSQTSPSVSKDVGEDDTSPKRRETPPPVREVHLPDPLPSYITKIDKPPGRVLKESLHCTTCDVYVNSENQMKQHQNSLRHKNTLQGIPTPPKPGREEKPKLRSEQYRCNVCKVTLNSDIQLSQHLASQRHKNMMEGKPPKPRWSPYEKPQQALLHNPSLRLPFKSLPTPSLLPPHPSPSVPTTIADLNMVARSSLSAHYLAYPNANQTALKQPQLVIPNGGVLPGREIIYVGGTAPLQQMTAGSGFPEALPAFTGLLQGQQPVQLQQVVTAPPVGLDWMTAAGLRLAT